MPPNQTAARVLGDSRPGGQNSLDFGGHLHATGDQPLRLLNQVDNGLGGITSITYAAQNDSQVASASQSDYAIMPNHVWVVKDVTRTDSLSGTAGVSEVRYGDPVWNEDHLGRWGFRGFESIETSSAHDVDATSGFAVTEQQWDYSSVWSGRLALTAVFEDGFVGNQPFTIDSTTYQELSVLEGASLSYLPSNSAHRRCEAGQDFVACSMKPYDILHVESYQASTAIGSTSGAVIAHRRNQRITSFQGAPFELLEWEQDLYSDANRYRYHSKTQKSHRQLPGGGWDQTGHRTWALDSTSTFVQEASVYASQTESWNDNMVRSLDTGLIDMTMDPRDVDSGHSTVYSYSGFKVTPTGVANEFDHTATVVTDLGTGGIIETRGPNVLTCDAGQNGGNRIEHDGLGRPIAFYEIGCSGGIYDPNRLLITHEYVNFDATTPAHVIATTHIDDTTSTVTKTFVDGAGRTVKTVLDPGGEAITTDFIFNARGQPERYRGPDPSAEPNSTATIDASYVYDSLGRATGIRQGESGNPAPAPGSGAWDNFVGVDISYEFDGTNEIKKASQHFTDGAIEAPEGETLVYTDFFGRMTKVMERLAGGGHAVTLYDFDGNDNVRRLTDADGIDTEMEHDWLSRRTKVARGEREWTYAYDKNGNLEFEVSPNDIGETASAPGMGFYGNSTVYDALDRPTSRVIGTRKLRSEQIAAFDAETVVYTYDTCLSGKGLLCSVATGNNLLSTFVHDYAGRVVEQTESFLLPEALVDFGDSDSDPDFVSTRTFYIEYNQSGGVAKQWLPDGDDKESSTQIDYNYDSVDGSPHSLSWNGVTASVTRNRARRVTQETLGCMTRNWDFDHLGRVTRTAVVAGAGAGSGPGVQDCSVINGAVLSEDISYFDSSDVRTHEVFRTGIASTRKFSYQYDPQGQLVGARNGVDGTLLDYQVGFAYTAAGRLSSVGDHGAGGGIVGRAPMDYSPNFGGYGDGSLLDADEHAPVALRGSDLDLTYKYDFAGNVMKRDRDPAQGPEESIKFAYDGLDQQREATLDKNNKARELYFYDSVGSRYMAATYEEATDSVPSRIRIWVGGMEFWYSPENSGPGNGNNSNGMTLNASYAHIALGGMSIARLRTIDGITTAEASFHNGLGHLMGAADLYTGVVNAAFVYGPYGELLDSSGGEQDTHLRRFNGKEQDEISSLSYYGYRYYDELSLSWTQADPLYRVVPDLAGANPREMGLYQFSMNNPVRYIDPDGLAASDSQYAEPVVVDTPDGPMECQGGRGSSDCEYHKPIYGDESPYGRTLIGRQLIEAGKLIIEGAEKDISEVVLLISDLARVSIDARAYFNRMLAFKPGTKVNGLEQPGFIQMKFVRDDDRTVIDSYALGRLDLAEVLGQPDNKDLLRTMHVIVEWWEGQRFLANHEPTVVGRLWSASPKKLKERSDRRDRVHDAAILFNNTYLRPLFGLSAREFRNPRRTPSHWTY